MKLTIDIDCTPAEAREMMGLPNVQKLQEEWLKQVEAKMAAEIEGFSPENLLKSWTAGASSNLEMFSKMMNAFNPGSKD